MVLLSLLTWGGTIGTTHAAQRLWRLQLLLPVELSSLTACWEAAGCCKLVLAINTRGRQPLQSV